MSPRLTNLMLLLILAHRPMLPSLGSSDVDVTLYTFLLSVNVYAQMFQILNVLCKFKKVYAIVSCEN